MCYACVHVRRAHTLTSAQVIVSLARVHSSTCCTETKGDVMTTEPEGSAESHKRVLTRDGLVTDHYSFSVTSSSYHFLMKE